MALDVSEAGYSVLHELLLQGVDGSSAGLSM